MTGAKIKRIPEVGWAVFVDDEKILPPGNRWYGSKRAAMTALAAVVARATSEAS